jgi:hypothetical protein
VVWVILADSVENDGSRSIVERSFPTQCREDEPPTTHQEVEARRW